VPVVIENRGGASGMIDAEMVAKAPADGYTILLSASPEVALNAALFSKMPYHPVKDFAPITLATVTPMALVVHPSMPAQSVQEYIAMARSNPSSVTYGSAGTGSAHHFAGEWLKMLAKVDMVHVSYKGQAPALTDLVAGHVSSGFATLLPAMQHLKAGRLRALAVTTAVRAPLLPDVPPIVDALAGFDMTQWNAVWRRHAQGHTRETRRRNPAHRAVGGVSRPHGGARITGHRQLAIGACRLPEGGDRQIPPHCT
jgi:tripartite-type tricarboxylate transporter receptor subunit TctC